MSVSKLSLTRSIAMLSTISSSLLILNKPLTRALRFPIPNLPLATNPRGLSSLSTAAIGNNAGGGRAGALSPAPVTEDLQKIDVNPPKGTRDFPPEDMRLRSWLFFNFREVSRLFGFEEVDFPVLESEALFVRKAGEEIRDQLYCFEDRGNRRVALRPELTPSLARLVIQKGKSLSLPLKWFAVGQCWRYERMTRGRRREHYQWNMDIIGVPEVMVLQEVLRRYSIPEALFGKVCIIIDKIEKLPLAEIKKELESVGVLEEAIEQLLQVLSIKSLTELEEILGDSGEAVADLKQLFSLVDKFGYSEWIQFDASIVRGLAYYTGIVFEMKQPRNTWFHLEACQTNYSDLGFDRGGKLRAICGGGRYDRLLSTFGGDDIPACGFGFGDAVIIELLKEKGLLPELGLQVENIVCALDPGLQGAAATVATILREKGQSVDLVLESKPLKWVFKRASRINASRLILVGDSEWQKGMVGVKILSTGEQQEIKLDELD
ncbi:histidine--tRNA ligase, chloroplastic/mitochondrial isoform X3 [Rosa chinensis]|uniref:histidine--tRNA ligase, chloroplastic/mitochondrial isoform X3 n=1 Tax=Rosa chinensis TaxID=74649 RepID=UPI001AD92F4F|nr:histidine--tRNA ligase, chloroplastic/mitochondrial isoform X3 [Rosa chinensis]